MKIRNFASKVKTEVVSVDAAHATQAAQGQKTIAL